MDSETPMATSSSSFALFRLNTEVESLLPLDGCSFITRESDETQYVLMLEYTMRMDEGVYEGRTIHFILKIPGDYPFKPPKLICLDDVFHPNIDENGNVCMEILRLSWTPGYGLNDILVNLHIIFIEIDGEDALNTVAGDLFKSDYDRFVRIARNLDKPD